MCCPRQGCDGRCLSPRVSAQRSLVSSKAIVWAVAALIALCQAWIPVPAVTLASPQELGPTLSIPQELPAAGPGTVTVPVSFRRNRTGVAGLAFSLRFDTTCLALETNDGQLSPGQVSFTVAPQFRTTVAYDPVAGEDLLAFAIADYAPPLSTMPDIDGLVQITFQVICEPAAGQAILAQVDFGDRPRPTFSDTLGRALRGNVAGGSVIIARADPAQTPTPTATPPPASTPSAPNTAPIAGDDVAFTTEYKPVTIDVLANDSDPDGDTLAIIEVSHGAIGRTSANPDNTITYVPAPGQNGVDLFAYTVSDGQGGIAQGFVEVTIADVNLAPVARNDAADTLEDTPTVIAVLSNDEDTDARADDAPLTIVVLGQPAHGSAQLDSDNTVTYVPALDFAGTDSFSYAIMDGEGAYAVATVVITVLPVNDPPRITPPFVEPLAPGEEVLVAVDAFDPDTSPEALHFSATGLPPGLTIDASTGEIHGIVDPLASGDFLVTITVDDGQASSSVSFVWTVKNEDCGTLPGANSTSLYLPLVGG